MLELDPQTDALVDTHPAGADPAFFDRFYFNLHGTDPTPLVMIGGGVYPAAEVVDGYVIVVDGGVQHNLRFSDVGPPRDHVGPLAWRTVEPLRTWTISIDENPLGLELDVTWNARTAPWRTDDIVVDNGRGGSSRFTHFFQSGTYDGTLTWAGRTHRVDGWVGQRDRSRGVRAVAGGQGMHLWVQAQFTDLTVAFIADETRAHEMYLCDGAVLHTDGAVDPIVDVRHDLDLDDGLDLRRGRLVVTTASGRVLDIGADGSAGGGFLSGGGYGGWHGKARGHDHLEHDTFLLDGSVSPRTLDMPLTDRPTRFTLDGETGAGILEFAVTRSPTYTYRPSLR